MGGKKRKYECVDVDAEKLLYTHFQHAANSIATLYSGSVTAQRRAAARASRATLERILHVLLKDFAASETVPKAALFQVLQQEYENVEGSEHLPHSFPVHLFPQPPAGPVQTEDVPAAAHAPLPGMGVDSSHAHQKRQHHHYHTGQPNMLSSPPGSRRAFPFSGGGPLGGPGAGAGAMEVSDQEQQQQQQQQQPVDGHAMMDVYGGGYLPFGGQQQQQ